MRYIERDEEQRRLFRRELERLRLAGRTVYFPGGSGVDHRLHRPRAWSPRGEPVYTDTPGGRRGRTSVISASLDGRLVCPVVFDGHCNRDVVDAYLAKALLPAIPRGSVIVLDNASFHRSPSTLALAEAAGCTLMFLPAYSPDLNPIEHIWAALKKSLQRGMQRAENKSLFIAKTCLCYC
jgi:transposase